MNARTRRRRLGRGVVVLALGCMAALGLGLKGAQANVDAPAAACTATPWSSTANYPSGAMVSHNGHQWRANSWLWPGVEPGVSGAPPWWVPWQDRGVCGPGSTTTTAPTTTTTQPPGSTTTTPATTTTTVPPAESVGDVYSAPGPWAVTSQTVGIPGIGVQSFLYYPADLGAGGYQHPILTWGTGAGGDTETYTDTFEHLASWGFVVVAPHGPAEFTHIVTAAEWMVARDSDPSSAFHDVLATDKVGALGHSRGAGHSSIAVGENPDLFSTLVPISFTDPWTHFGDTRGVDALSAMGDIPVFFVAGTADGLVSQGSQQSYFNLKPGAAARAAVVGGGHNVIQQTDNAMQPYITAWLKYALEGDQFARRAFVGSPPEINTDPAWAWQQQKNLP